MNTIPRSVQKLIDQFSSLPGIGPKTASRLTFFLLSQPDEIAKTFGEAAANLKNKVTTCQQCFNIAENNPCQICTDKTRDRSIIAVVEHPLDVIALEKTGQYQGLYHVLGGAISPVDDIGPENLRINELIARIKRSSGEINEVILATNPSLEGEATAMYLQKKLQSFKIKITRIARGLPVGGDLEYADEITLQRALEGRKEY